MATMIRSIRRRGTLNKPARFTQAELSRALRAARQEGARVKVRDGVIEFDFRPIPESQEPDPRELETIAPQEKIIL